MPRSGPAVVPSAVAAFRRTVPLVAAALAFAAGASAAIYYARNGLALSHYDARAHLVVARRIFDSLTPGWQQVGAVWLPLPHLLNALPVQIDAFYRTGASAIAISVMSGAVAAWALAAQVGRSTASATAAIAAALLLVLNPNVLYLLGTPMTEPLLFGLTFLAAERTAAWLDAGATTPPRAAGLALAGMCLTRYEAWPILGAVLTLTPLALVAAGERPRRALGAAARLAVIPAAAIALFMLNSRWTIGAWFVTGGFFVAENPAKGHPLLAWQQVRETLASLAGSWLLWAGSAAALLIVTQVVRRRVRPSLLLLLAPAAAAALPLYAYLQGHPVRVRYAVPLIVAATALCGAGVGLLPRRARLAAATGLVVLMVLTHRPFEATAPMVIEAQRDTRNRAGRQAVTDYLLAHYDGRTPIMTSMGSLAHYMQDLSRDGLALRSFLHEGNGELWGYAIQEGPQGFADWVLVEEKAEGGDAIYQRARQRPTFFTGYTRVASGGGVALYRRVR
jgi:hypothetical protein